ncbi:MAG: serine/threonine protein kinase [Polyangiaceae bacterium]|nr:serine/threonine protein kinase [Polyangiaceae bacterium]
MTPGAGRKSLTPNRYTLHDEIGAGGMASVFLGRVADRAVAGDIVAIKRLHPHLARDQKFVAMLLDEADLASRIRHPNVVSVLDVVAVDREFILVMEYVHGEALARLLGTVFARQERVAPEVAARITIDVLRGLHAAHETPDDEGRPLDIVHRDVSPHNVMVGTDGRTRVLDFGVAKAARRLQTTRTGETKGKIAYMAPEQLLGHPCDRRVDLHAAAVLLWEMLVGRRLYAGENEGLVVARILAGEVESPSELADGVSPELGAVVVRGLATDAEARFATAAEMADALTAATPPAVDGVVGDWVRVNAREALTARDEMRGRLRSLATAASENTNGAMTLGPTAAIPPRRNRWRWLGIGATATVALVAVAVGYGSRNVRETPRDTAAPEPPPARSMPPTPTADRLASAAPALTTPRRTFTAPPPSNRPPRSATRTAAPSARPAPPNCVPPYTVDAHGIRRVRRECFASGGNR